MKKNLDKNNISAINISLLSFKGHQQTIFIQATLTSQAWNNDLLNHESDAYITLSQLIQEKVFLNVVVLKSLNNQSLLLLLF